MTSQWRHKLRMSKNAKIAKIVVFRYFFKQMLHFLAMMCVKECLHTFLLQINQINKIKHSRNAQKRKTRFMCNFNGKSSFSLTRRAIMKFYKNGLRSSARLKGKKSRSFSAKKMSTRGDITKISEGADYAPGSFRVNYVKDVANNRLKSKIYNVKSHPAKIIIYYCWNKWLLYVTWDQRTFINWYCYFKTGLRVTESIIRVNKFFSNLEMFFFFFFFFFWVLTGIIFNIRSYYRAQI